MKYPFLPLALGLVATIAAPAHATNEQLLADAEVPVEPEMEATASHAQDAIALNFEPPTSSATPSNSTDDSTPSPVETPPETQQPTPASELPQFPDAPASSQSSREDLFEGGSKSVVARVVGAAEGTRNPDGSPTDLYEGHVDPGNGVWNRGTFSYQFGNEENLTADEADRRQMAKIKRIYDSVMLPKAEQRGVAPLTLAEELNGIDLINQAPLAMTEAGGYVERLAEAKQKKGLNGEEAILEARVWSFWDSDKGGWDAPGLRAYDDMGKEASIRHDQQRRMGMIDEALKTYEQQNGAIASAQTPAYEPTAATVSANTKTKSSRADAVADLIIFQNTQPSAGYQMARVP